MHRGNFRPKLRTNGHVTREAPLARSHPLADEIKGLLADLSRDVSPLKASVERLAAPKKEISVPEDIGKSLASAHNRLDRVERELAAIEQQLKRMSTTFSNALIALSEKVEKISGGEDSEFSLAHSLEKLIYVLTHRKLHIIRDRDGNMSDLEPKFEGE